MSRRGITHSRKDQDGDITALCNPGAAWSPRLKAGVIADIESGTHQYFVGGGGQEVAVNVIDGPTGKFLRTDPDTTNTNNLDDLPDC